MRPALKAMGFALLVIFLLAACLTLAVNLAQAILDTEVHRR